MKSDTRRQDGNHGAYHYICNGALLMFQETACRLVKSVGDNLILGQILSNGVKATRKCKGKNSGNKVDDMCPKASSCGKQTLWCFSLKFK